MIGIKLDLTQVHALARDAVDSLTRRQPAGMLRILRRAAAEEVSGHTYQNRTTNLENSTFASDIRQGYGEYSVELGARMEYASFVEGRGYSRITEIAEAAFTEVDYYFDGERDRLSGR